MQKFFPPQYIDASNFIKIAANDTIDYLISHNNKICGIINCSKEL